jgi:hypothetical protein
MAAAAADIARVAFEDALSRIGFAAPERNALILESSCTNIAMLGILPSDQIRQICKRLRTRAVDPVPITAIQEQLLQAMRFWVAGLQRFQQIVDPALFTTALALNQAQVMQQALEDEARVDKEVVAKAPYKFKNASKWKVFAEAMETYLMQLYRSGKVPLNYEIRPDTVAIPGAVYPTEQARMVALAPLNGSSFQRDNAKVYGIIKQLVLEGPGRTFIMQYDSQADGRAAWLALKAHYEGEGFRNRNVKDAYATLDRLSYEGEKRGFTFEKFLERHLDSYLELERFNEPVLETKKVRDLLTRIKAPELAAAKQQVRATDRLSNSFEEAANFLALSIVPLKVATRQVASTATTPSTTTATGSSHSGGGQGGGRGKGRGRGRGHVRGGRGRGRLRTTYYTPDEWYNLSQDQRSRVLEAQSLTSTDGGGTARRQVSTVVSGSGQDDAALALTTPTTIVATVSTAGRDQGGNAGNHFGQRSRTIGALSSGNRHIHQVQSDFSQTDKECYGYLELDSHADTCTVGANCRIISVSKKSCNVTPYHPKYQAIRDCPIVPAGTAYTDPDSGITYILIVNQAIHVGHDLPTTLLNPNQMRSNGIIVDDCPKHLAPDPSVATHSLFVPQHNLRIPLHLNGVISCIPSHYPSSLELETCQWIELTPSDDWDPHASSFVEEEEQMQVQLDTIHPKHDRSISAVLNESICKPVVSFDQAVSRKVMVASTTSTPRSTESLKNKIASTFGIGLETAQRTLQATTQLALRNVTHPIHRRYRTDVAQLRYPRLGGIHGKFHTDTLFCRRAISESSDYGANVYK